MIRGLALVLLAALGFALRSQWNAAPSLTIGVAATLSTFALLAALAPLRTNRVFRSGVALLTLGTTSNAVAIFLNGGRMPFVGPFQPHGIWVAADVSTRVPWLIDRFNGASLGDVLITLGTILLGAGAVPCLFALLDPETAQHERRLVRIGGLYALAMSVLFNGTPWAVGGAAASTAQHTLADVRRGAARTVRSLTLPPAQPDTLAAIRAASEAYRLDVGCMLDLATTLSTTGRDPRAYAPGAAAVGLYRITPATWLWASRGQYGHTLPLEAREDDRISAWVAAYVMDLAGATHWHEAGARDCRLYGEHGPPPWDGYRTGAHPYVHWVSDYWLPVSYEQEFAAAERQWLRTCAEERDEPWAEALAWRCAPLWAQWDQDERQGEQP